MVLELKRDQQNTKNSETDLNTYGNSGLINIAFKKNGGNMGLCNKQK